MRPYIAADLKSKNTDITIKSTRVNSIIIDEYSVYLYKLEKSLLVGTLKLTLFMPSVKHAIKKISAMVKIKIYKTI